MTTKRYIILFKEGNKNTWESFDTLDAMAGFLKRCTWIEEFKIIDCEDIKI